MFLRKRNNKAVFKLSNNITMSIVPLLKYNFRRTFDGLDGIHQFWPDLQRIENLVLNCQNKGGLVMVRGGESSLLSQFTGFFKDDELKSIHFYFLNTNLSILIYFNVINSFFSNIMHCPTSNLQKIVSSRTNISLLYLPNLPYYNNKINNNRNTIGNNPI